jgi:hypothetical protein
LSGVSEGASSEDGRNLCIVVDFSSRRGPRPRAGIHARSSSCNNRAAVCRPPRIPRERQLAGRQSGRAGMGSGSVADGFRLTALPPLLVVTTPLIAESPMTARDFSRSCSRWGVANRSCRKVWAMPATAMHPIQSVRHQRGNGGLSGSLSSRTKTRSSPTPYPNMLQIW